jgi:Putative peptidoglycan binding domain
MKRTIITLLATAAMTAPAFAANNPANQPQQPSKQQQQQQSNPQQSQAKPQDTQQQAEAQPQNGNQPIPPNSLSRSEVRQMQSALDQKGFNAGKPDGKLGPRTKQALQKFDQKNGIQSENGQPTEQTLAQLGVNQNQDQNQQQNGSQQQPNQNGQ